MRGCMSMLVYCSVSAAHIFPFSPPSGGSASVEKIIASSNFNGRDFSSGIGMTPFYRSVPSQIILSDGGADGSSIEGHPWPAYQRINSQGVRTSQQAGTGQDRGTDYLTVDQMRQFLRKLSKQKNSFAAGREIKWSV